MNGITDCVVSQRCSQRGDPDRTESGAIVFPFEAVKVEFLLQAA